MCWEMLWDLYGFMSDLLSFCILHMPVEDWSNNDPMLNFDPCSEIVSRFTTGNMSCNRHQVLWCRCPKNPWDLCPCAQTCPDVLCTAQPLPRTASKASTNNHSYDDERGDYMVVLLGSPASLFFFCECASYIRYIVHFLVVATVCLKYLEMISDHWLQWVLVDLPWLSRRHDHILYRYEATLRTKPTKPSHCKWWVHTQKVDPGLDMIRSFVFHQSRSNFAQFGARNVKSNMNKPPTLMVNMW